MTNDTSGLTEATVKNKSEAVRKKEKALPRKKGSAVVGEREREKERERERERENKENDETTATRRSSENALR